MEKVLIFGSTPESRDMARMLRRRGRQVVVSVVSECGHSLLPVGMVCHVGRLDAKAMLDFVRQEAPNRIVDATHPYAVTAHQNISNCAETLGIPCERVHFADIKDAWRDAVEWVATMQELKAAILREKANMLLGIGRDVVPTEKLDTDMHRLFARVTPTPEAVAAVTALGFPRENIIAMDGPFSRELTMALLEQKNITSVVVQDATDSDYLYEMVIPALEKGMHVIMYGQK